MLVLEDVVGFHVDVVEPVKLSFFGINGWGMHLNYCDIEWFALETNRDHSVGFFVVVVVVFWVFLFGFFCFLFYFILFLNFT